MKRKRSDEKSFRAPSGAALKRPELTQALYKALFKEWARCGYQAISLENVAARAGAGKAAIYRRWDSKLSFANEAIEAVRPRLSTLPPQDSLEKDISLYLLHLRRILRHPIIRRVLPDLHAEQARGGELTPIIEQLAQYRRSLGAAWLKRAVDRGELSSETDIDFALDLIPSPLYWRIVVRNQTISKNEILLQAQCMANALKASSQRQPTSGPDRITN